MDWAIAAGFGSNLALTALVTAGCMVALWLLSLKLKDMSIVDLYWGPGFGIVALVTYFASVDAGVDSRRLLVTVLTCAWGFKLGLYLFQRNHGKGEDPRYTDMIRVPYAGQVALQSLLRVFVLQGVILWLISLPVQLAQYQTQPTAIGVIGWLGALLWLVGFLFETVGDWQLKQFKADPANRGKVMDRGLWRYTRHPNYFGNACLWWGLWLIACDHWSGLVLVFAPLLMTHFLLNVTGKKLLEERMIATRPGYAEYVARTSGFLPWPPKRG